MSHYWNCPDDSEARREARRDADYGGWNRHRYQDECPEAHEVYEREFRREQYRIEERAEEERAEARAVARRREASYEADRREQDDYYDRQWQFHQAAIFDREAHDYYLALEMDEGRVNRDAEQGGQEQ